MNYTSVRFLNNRIMIRLSDGTTKSANERIFLPEIYIRSDTPTDKKSIHGHYLKPVGGLYKYWEIREWSKNNKDINHIYGQSQFEYEFIRKFFRNKVKPITKKDVYGLIFDIETGRDEKGYSSPAEARCPITSISAKDTRKDYYMVWSTENFDPDKFDKIAEKHKEEIRSENIIYVKCEDERELLLTFLNFWITNYPHYITGWNTKFYDIPYFINRLFTYFPGDGITNELISSLSPFGIVIPKTVKNDFGKEVDTYDITGINDLDYFALYKKFTYTGQESYTLNHIGFVELKRKKIDYSEEGNLTDLFDIDFEKFILYNITDVSIVEGIDEKLNLIDLVMSLAYKTGANWGDMVSPVKTWDVLIYNVIGDQGTVIPFFNDMSYRENYIGAYVKDVNPRMYNWVASFDLNSLYPHLQMQYNLSPEKHVSFEELPVEIQDYIINDIPHDVSDCIQWMLDAKLNTGLFIKYGLAFTPNGQCWKKDSDGFIPMILNGLYAERSESKKEMLRLKQQIENKEISDDNLSHVKNEISRLDTLQKAMKILMNSEYGAMANVYFRYFSLEIAEAITSSGQLAIRWAGKHINNFLNRYLDTRNNEYVFYMDTDSLYIEFEKVVESFDKSLSIEEKITKLDEFCSDIIEPKIDKIYDMLALYTNAHNQKMVMKREVLANKGVYTSKKRYALNVYDSEHVRYAEPKIKIMGLESVRSSIPDICRKAYEKVVKILLSKGQSEIHEFIEGFEEEFNQVPIADISFPRGTNNIEKWCDSKLIPKKGCPVHVRAAIVFNRFLIENKITTIESIKSGDKIKFCYLKNPNPLNSHVVGFPSYVPKELYEVIKDYIDYKLQFEKSFLGPVTNLLYVTEFSPEHENTLEHLFEEV